MLYYSGKRPNNSGDKISKDLLRYIKEEFGRGAFSVKERIAE